MAALRMKPPIALLWSGMYFVLLLSSMTPFVIITVSLLMLPPLVLYGTQGRWRFIPYCAAPLLLLLLMFQVAAVPALIVAIFFLIPAVVMGELYRRDSSAGKVLLAGVLVMIGELLLSLLISYALNFDVARELRRMMWDHYQTFPSLMPAGISEEVLDLSIRMLTQMIPFFMILIGVFYVSISHMLGRRVLNYFGVPASKLPPIRQWMLPKSLVLYYVIALFLDMFIKKSLGSFLTTILLNGIPFLMAAFMVQALSFLMFVSHKKKWGILLPVMGIVAAPFLPSLVSFLGVLDAAFPLRKRIQS